mgnify:CR=1 FL=1
MDLTEHIIIDATINGRSVDCNTGYEQDAIARCNTWTEAAAKLAFELLYTDTEDEIEVVEVTISEHYEINRSRVLARATIGGEEID